MATGGRILELRGLRKQYRGVTALADCNLAVAQGEFVTLLGPSGCGKTTTLRIVAGFVRPDSGEVRLAGVTLSSPTTHVPPERRNMGMVFQSYAVWPHMSVRRNVELPLRVRRIKAAEIAERSAEILRLCRLETLAERHPHELSGGQLQRVALARALVYRPQIVLLDEPLSNLDVTLREELREEIRRLHKTTGATFILVTHDQAEAMSLSDRVAVMNAGGIQQIGTPHEIYLKPKTDFVAQFAGAANLLRGVIAASAADAAGLPRWQVRVAGLVLAVRGRGAAAAGTEITLALHPEAIRLEATGRAAPDDGAEEGRVTAISFLGRTQEIAVEVAGVALRVVQLRGPDLCVGDRVKVSIAPEAAIPLVDGADATEAPATPFMERIGK